MSVDIGWDTAFSPLSMTVPPTKPFFNCKPRLGSFESMFGFLFLKIPNHRKRLHFGKSLWEYCSTGCLPQTRKISVGIIIASASLYTLAIPGKDLWLSMALAVRFQDSPSRYGIV